MITENETRPMTFEIFGTDHTITDNIIGRDVSGDDVGVCGIAFLMDGRDHVVTDNTIIRSRKSFENVDSVIYTQDISTSGSGFPFMEIHNNVITDADDATDADKAYRFGTSIPIQLRQHVPAKITNVSGTSVSGTNGTPLPLGQPTDCPNCIVYLYLDDLDGNIEALELIGTGTFNGAGTSWTGTLNRTLTSSEALRTQNRTNADNVIANYGANTTTRFSDELYTADGTPLAVALSGQSAVGSGQWTVVVFAALFMISLVGWKALNRAK